MVKKKKSKVNRCSEKIWNWRKSFYRNKFFEKNSDEIIRKDDVAGMKWKQQSGQFRLAQANRLPLSSLNLIYLVQEAKRPPGHLIRCRHTQCHTTSHVAELAESMKFTGKLKKYAKLLRLTEIEMTAWSSLYSRKNWPWNWSSDNYAKQC